MKKMVKKCSTDQRFILKEITLAIHWYNGADQTLTYLVLSNIIATVLKVDLMPEITEKKQNIKS